jgi:Uma2 family endonuclease
MSAVSTSVTQSFPSSVLRDGAQMTREDFHRAYEQTPDDFKAELIGGIVHVSSPLRIPHAKYSSFLIMLVGLYRAGTPGVECGDNATIILSDDSEPQPDIYLRILPAFGGRSQTTPHMPGTVFSNISCCGWKTSD